VTLSVLRQPVGSVPGRWLQLDLLAVAGGVVATTAWVLLPVPVLQILGGLLLPVVLQGAAVGLATLPPSAERGLLGTTAVLGVVATVVEVIAIDRVGVGVTRGSVTLTSVLVTALALSAAAARRARPVLRWPSTPGLPIAVVAGSAAVAVVTALVVGTRIPLFSTGAFSTVSLGGPLAGVTGVITAGVGEPVPVTVRVANHEQAERTYTVSLRDDETEVTVPAGAVREIPVGTVTVPDGCPHRFPVTTRSAGKRYLLTLYVKGRAATCSKATP
jgi:hypothetical protein